MPSSKGKRERSQRDAKPEAWKRYSEYDVDIDRHQDDKSVEIVLTSFARPHMRAFHCSWLGFFTAFSIWFAIVPLLPDIRDDLGLSKKDIWTSSMYGVGGTIFVRFLLGPLCDKFGPRAVFAIVLCTASIPTACTGLVHTATGLNTLRFFIGIAGGTFVMCQDWTTRMFTKEIVGTANAIVAGWGNLGAGVTRILVGNILFPVFRLICNGDTELAWRTVCIVPAVVTFVLALFIYYHSDDCPKGNFTDLKARGTIHKDDVSAVQCFGEASKNVNSWLLFIQYACCFGVELTMNNAAADYFEDEFGLTTTSAVVVATVFVWMNLFARGLGGLASDFAQESLGMRGRLLVQTGLLLGEGGLVLVFVQTKTLMAAIMVFLLFSLFVQACEGATYGIVPYVDESCTGSVTGIVGAGGNTGAVLFGFAFRELGYKDAFMLMGLCVIASSFLSFFITIQGESNLLPQAKPREEQEAGTPPQSSSGTGSTRSVALPGTTTSPTA